MNLKRRVWLPPDGDSRLVRFQQRAARCSGLEAALPPHLELSVPGRPLGPVVSGAWRLHEGEPGWDAWDDRGPLGFFRLGLLGRDWHPEDLAILPPAPGWKWTKGQVADLLIERPLGSDSFILWSWGQRHGWKSDRPRG